MKKFAVIAVLVSLLNGCATTGDSYKEYPTNQPHATIRGSDTGMIASRTVMQLVSIDGKPITFLWSASDKFSVSPGAHTVKAYAFIKEGAFADGRQVEVKIRFNAIAGYNYSLQSKVNGDQFNVWIVDQRGRISSPVVTADHLPLGAKNIAVRELPH